MPTSTPLTADTLRIKNKTTGRGVWLVTTDEGTLTFSEVNPDRGHCPDLLSVDPVASPAPAVFTTSVATTATFQFDGELGAGSTVAVTNPGVAGTVSAISLAGSTMVFSYTAATGDVLKFTVKSADGSKTARRLYTPATITLGPAYLADSLTKTLYTDGWPASATLNFDRSVASVATVTLVSDSGAQAGTLSHSLSGSTLTLSNVITTPATSKIRITGATDGAGFSTAVIDVPVTRQAATKPTLTSISQTTFTYGVEAYTDLVFNETLQSFTPTINGAGATVTTTWVAGQNTARVFVTAAADTTSLTFQVVDSNDGGSDTITSALTIVAPTQPVLLSLSDSSFTTGIAKSVTATFDRAVQSLSGITVASGGTASITSALPSNTVTFSVTADTVASPGYLYFNNVVSTESSAPVTRSWQITVAAPFDPLEGVTFEQLGLDLFWDGTLPDLVVPGNTKLVYYYPMNAEATASWVQVNFAVPQQLTSFNRAMTAGSGNNSWLGEVVGLDASGNQTSLGTNFPLIGAAVLQVNSPTAFKSYRFVKRAGVTWGNGPAIIRWDNFVFA
jgi:hypothetical protein